MAKLDRTTLKHLTKLCRIDCTADEEEALLKDLQNILSYVEQLQEIDTSNVSPCNHVLAEINSVMREDVVGETLPREVFLENAPEQIAGMIRVPLVIKK